MQVHGVVEPLEWTGSVTTGSLSDPRVGDNNGGRNSPAASSRAPPPGLALGDVGVARRVARTNSLDEALAGTARATEFAQAAVAPTPSSRTARWLVRGE